MAAGGRRRPAAWLPALLPLLARTMQLEPGAPARRGGGAGEAPARRSLAPQEVEAALEGLDAEAEADQEAEVRRPPAAQGAGPWRLSAAPGAAAGEGAGAQGPPEGAAREEEVYWRFAKSMGAAVREEARAEEAEEGPAEEVPAESPEEAMDEEEMVADGPANDSEAGADQGLEKLPDEATREEESGTGAPILTGGEGAPTEHVRAPQKATGADRDDRGALRLAGTRAHDRSWRDAEAPSAASLACAAAFSSYDSVCDGLEWARGQCSFVVTTRGASCADYCGAQGSECLAAADNAGSNCTVNPLPQGRGGEPTTASFCPARFVNQICVCRPVGSSAGQAALAQVGAAAASEAEQRRGPARDLLRRTTRPAVEGVAV